MIHAVIPASATRHGPPNPSAAVNNSSPHGPDSPT